MFCREWTLVKHCENVRLVKPLFCKSWGCELCQPLRRAQLMARAASGAPNRFLTLTVNPRVGDSPADRLRMLSHAWNVLVKCLRREHGTAAVQYLAVVESTKAGEPHLHILLRSPFIPQGWLSARMAELTGSPIVDIRKIHNTTQAVRYVAKYVGKRPAQFGTSKRYWLSKDYEPAYDAPPRDPATIAGAWAIVRVSIDVLTDLYIRDGFAGRQYDRDTLYFVKMGTASLEPPRGTEPRQPGW